jgi:hypothetical protein
MKKGIMSLKVLNIIWLIFSVLSIFVLTACKKSTEVYPGVATFNNATVANTQDGFGLIIDYSVAGINGVSDFDSIGYVFTFDNVVYKEIFPDSLRLYSRFVSGKGAKSFSGQTYAVGLNSTVLVRPAVAYGGRISFGEEKSVSVNQNGLPKTTESILIEKRNQITCIAGNEGVLMGGGIIVDTQNQLTSFYKMEPSGASIVPVADIPGSAGCEGPMGYYRNGKYYLMGGQSNNVATDKIWTYTASTNTWAEEGTFPGGAAFAGFTASSGNYLVSGCYRNGSDVPVNTVYKMAASGQSWDEIKSPPSDFKPRSHAAAFIVGDYLYISGGAANSYIALNDTWKVNLITEEWTRLEDAPLIFYGAPALTFEDVAYVGMGIFKDDSGKVRKDLILGFDTNTEKWFLYADGNSALTSVQHLGSAFKMNNKGFFISTTQSPAYIHQVR